MTQALISSTALAICSQKISCRSESDLMTPAKIVDNTTLRLDNRFASPEAVLNSLRMDLMPELSRAAKRLRLE